jgi:hypothetical protein
MAAVQPDPQSEIIRAASSRGVGWVMARDLWADKGVRGACSDEWALISTLLTMYLRGLLVMGVSSGELAVWASDQPPPRTKGVLFRIP